MKLNSSKYCNSLTSYSRFITREVNIGDVPLGGNHPIRVQSMTTTDTMDTVATVNQAIRMIEAGCEYVRITAPSINEAHNLKKIKNLLHQKGYKTPLIADIHFTPNAAETAARIVEKVRINPGNYADKKKFKIIEYSDYEYEEELQRIREKFSPLVKICKEYGTALRIGTNHGSLSDRIMSRYGDTPEGMVESAMEFIWICEDLRFFNIVLSMKASNPQVMVHAYRLLVNKMIERKMNYPIHLGVTEAGGGEDGRIKSAVGIGSLLEDGIGDTIRVSLTEDPEFEIPVARELVFRYSNRAAHNPIPIIQNYLINPFQYSRRQSQELIGIGGGNVPKVIISFNKGLKDYSELNSVGFFYNEITDKWMLNDTGVDFIYIGKNIPSFDIPNGLRAIIDFDIWKTSNNQTTFYPLFTAEEFLQNKNSSALFNFVEIGIKDLTPDFIEVLKNDSSIILIITTDNEHGMAEQRKLFLELLANKIFSPVIIKRSYHNIDVEKIKIYSSTDFGALLIDGLGDGIWLETSSENILKQDLNRISFGILQATRTRITKTEYIACPSCGRTLFDLQETTEKIRKETEHLKGLKIAVMGCIVNGPGEMADADYGYVGSGVGKITLYRGKEVVKKNIPAENSVQELINLIKEDNNWIEPV